MSYNPLVEAVDAYEKLLDAEGNVMFEVSGEAAFEPFDQALCDAVSGRVSTAADAIRQLSPRARRARLNAIWDDFLREQQKAREPAGQEGTAAEPWFEVIRTDPDLERGGPWTKI